MDASQLEAFGRGIDLFNRREFFECHEALEEAWTPARGPERLFLQALIHFAVGFHHHRGRNQEGTERQLRKGLRKIADYLPEFEGVETEKLRQEVATLLETIASGRRLRRYPKIVWKRRLP